MATATLAPPVTAAQLEQMLRHGESTGPLTRLIDEGSPVRYARLTAVGDQLTLLSVLREHAVPVYRPEDIKAYKAAMIKSTTKWSNRIAKVLPVTFFSSLVVALLACVVGIILSPTGLFSDVLLTLMVVGTAIGTLSGLACVWVPIKSAGWERYYVAYYRNEVPLSVIHLMDRLQRAIPRARLYIEELQVESRPLDPLLFVELGGAEYCVAVWDEPLFTADPVH